MSELKNQHMKTLLTAVSRYIFVDYSKFYFQI
jgi:hypothetical protein